MTNEEFENSKQLAIQEMEEATTTKEIWGALQRHSQRVDAALGISAKEKQADFQRILNGFEKLGGRAWAEKIKHESSGGSIQ